MNHRYFASLLENYRKRMGMDSSVLSIRKALCDSYQNESFKLKERQRHAMAKQRRDQMESDRIFRNRLKEITAKEKEIAKRYEHLRKPYVKDTNKSLFPAVNISGWQSEHFTDKYRSDFNVPRETTLTAKPHYYPEKNSILLGREGSKLKATDIKENKDETFPSIDASRWKTEHATELRQRREYHVHLPRVSALNKPSPYAELENSRVESNRGSNHVHKIKKQLTPHSPIGSHFTENLIDYYRNRDGLRSDKNAPALVGKQLTGISTMKCGVQNKDTRQKRPLNVTSPDFDILVFDRRKDDTVNGLTRELKF